MSALAAGAYGVSGAVNAYGIYQSSKYNAKLLDLQAGYLDMQAADLLVQGKAAEQDVIEQGRQLRENQKAGYAGQNVEVSSGSAMEVQNQTRVLAQKEADRVQLDYARQAWAAKTEASFKRLEAKNTRRTGRFQAASSLLSGGASAAGALA